MSMTSTTSVAALNLKRLHAASIHLVRPGCCQQRSSVTFGVRPCLARFGTEDSRCFACLTVQADAPDCNVKAARQVRYRGVMKLNKGYNSRIAYQGQSWYLGVYLTPEEAARVYDEARIVLKKDPVNFPRSQYDEAAILQIPELATFVRRKRVTIRQKTQTSRGRYRGVMKLNTGYNSRIAYQGQSWYLGVYLTPEEAARVYDEARIVLKKDPVNFPRSQYDEAAILQIPELATFVRRKGVTIRQKTQTSRGRYQGVYMKPNNRYVSQIHYQGKSWHLGVYLTAEDAARVYDEARIVLKEDPVNFPRSHYDEAAMLQIPEFATFVKQKRAHRQKTKFFRSQGVYFRSNKYVSKILYQGKMRHLGVYLTPEEAARVYDEARIVLKKDPVNFPKSHYDEAALLQTPGFATFVKRKRATNRQKTQSSRYIGVHKATQGRFPCQALIYLISCYAHLGWYETEEQAAMSHDESCIYQGRSPVNFPDHPYDTQDICRPADIAEFVQRSREKATRLVKAQQTSRFTGVSWHRKLKTWQAYVCNPRPVRIGNFEDEVEAAQAVDERRQQIGQEAVNFPRRSSMKTADVIRLNWPPHHARQQRHST